MADVFSKDKRSKVMSRIHSENTKVEMLVFRELTKRKIYFYRHYKRVIGKPDIALPRKKIAIFIDGDFWHGHDLEKWQSKLPEKYWLQKISDNVARDRRNRAKLRRSGWKVLRIWEHQLCKEPDKYISKIVQFLG